MGTFLGRRLDAWPGERAASLLRVGDDVHSPRQRPYFKRNLPYQGRPEKPPPGLTSGVRCHRTEALEWSRRSCQISRRASTGSVPRGYLWLRMAPPWSSPAGYNRGNKTRLSIPCPEQTSSAGSDHGPATMNATRCQILSSASRGGLRGRPAPAADSPGTARRPRRQ